MADETGKSSDPSSDKQPAKVQRDKLNANDGRVRQVISTTKSYPQGKSGQSGNQQNGGKKKS
jgi:hypothetical protein